MDLQRQKVSGEVSQLVIVGLAKVRRRVDRISKIVGAFLRTIVNHQHAVQRPAKALQLLERLDKMRLGHVMGGRRRPADAGPARAPHKPKLFRIREDGLNDPLDILVARRRPYSDRKMLRTDLQKLLEIGATVDAVIENVEVGRPVRDLGGMDERFVEIEDQQPFQSAAPDLGADARASSRS